MTPVAEPTTRASTPKAQTIAATVTAPGRSPAASGSSSARTAASFSSAVRRGGRGGAAGAAARWRLRRPNGPLQRRAQRASGGLRVGGLGDGAHDDDALGAGLGGAAGQGRVDPADREE